MPRDNAAEERAEALAEVIDHPNWRLVWMSGFDPLVEQLRYLIFDPKTLPEEREKAVYALYTLKEGFVRVYNEAGRSLPELLKQELGYTDESD